MKKPFYLLLFVPMLFLAGARLQAQGITITSFKITVASFYSLEALMFGVSVTILMVIPQVFSRFEGMFTPGYMLFRSINGSAGAFNGLHSFMATSLSFLGKLHVARFTVVKLKQGTFICERANEVNLKWISQRL